MKNAIRDYIDPELKKKLENIQLQKEEKKPRLSFKKNMRPWHFGPQPASK